MIGRFTFRNLCLFLGASGLIICFLLIIAASKDSIKAASYTPRTRIYYIAAEKTMWDYAPSKLDKHTGENVPTPWGNQTVYEKVRYIEYVDASFTTKKTQPEWLGILGPIIRGVPGDTIQVVFRNNTDRPYSIHPHGVLYDKDNEGATHLMPDMDKKPDTNHHDSSMVYGSGAKGSAIMPHTSYTYVWHVRDEDAPTAIEGGSKIWMYHSHVSSPSDLYDGLVGPIIITSKEHARADGTPDDVQQEFVTLFMVFDESNEEMNDEEVEASLKHSINGYIFANLPGLEMNKNDKIRWHLIGLGNEVDLHTPHWHGNIVKEKGYSTDVVELLPASMKTVDMQADNPGEWMYHCHVADHITAGMMASYTVHNSTSGTQEDHTED